MHPIYVNICICDFLHVQTYLQVNSLKVELLSEGLCFWYAGEVKWSEVAQSCPTVCDPMDCSLPGSSVHGIFQAVVLEWIAISFSRGSSQARDRTQVSHSVDRRLTVWTTREVWYAGSVQFSSVAQSCPTLFDPMNRSTPSLPGVLHHQLPEFTQTHVHRVSDTIQPSHPLWSPSPPAPNPSQHQSLFQWVNSVHEVAKVLEFQL